MILLMSEESTLPFYGASGLLTILAETCYVIEAISLTKNKRRFS